MPALQLGWRNGSRLEDGSLMQRQFWFLPHPPRTLLWGTGLFQSAARLMLDFAVGIMGVHRIEARTAAADRQAAAASGPR
jgi:RimJ/RimL family protein N-acetyltransferase